MARVTFTIHYVTRWGQNLVLERRAAAGAENASGRLPMFHLGDGLWELSLAEVGSDGGFEYRYVCTDEAGVTRREPRFRELTAESASEWRFDEWLAAELPNAAHFRQAMAGVVFNPTRAPASLDALPGGRRLRLTLRAPRVTKGHRICVTGSHPLLGQEDPTRAVVLGNERFPLWSVDLPLEAMTGAVEFKFGLWNELAGRMVQVEAGPNRRLPAFPHDRDLAVVNCEHYRHLEVWKGAGVAIPVFSLRSERGYGVGEFVDLEALTEWAAACGMHLVQLLPVNDTSADFTWKDSYPYKAISAMALHPIYLNVESLYGEYRLAVPEQYLRKREKLNRLAELDYETVLRDKLAYLREIFSEVGEKVLRSKAYKDFWGQQGDWLRPYAVFCRLRDLHHTADFTQWGADAAYQESKYRSWFKPGAPEYPEVTFHCFVQYHLEQQFTRAVRAGHARGVAFKGDLPIGIDRCSVEAWTEPALFHMDRQTGAPPDSFAVLGQNWGFPTYDWKRMAEDGYSWWRRRFHRMSACFDALRVDHILGFFRIWEIPGQCADGIMGHFNPALPFSREAIGERGFRRDPSRFAVPAVAQADIPRLFGGEAQRAVEQLLRRDEDGYLRIRPGFAEARARKAWYAAHCPAAASTLEEGMVQLGREVLFLEDPDQPGRFHPRINLQDSLLFQSMPAEEQHVLRDLHDDFYFRRHTHFWELEAMRKLPALMDATNILICGEDLGMIPDSVPIVLKRLGLLSLEVQRWPKHIGERFGNPAAAPHLSVCTTSTHDMPVLRGWWEEEPGTRQAFYEIVMGREGAAPAECSPEICRCIVWQHLSGPSMWCILPFQDWLALDPRLRRPSAAEERINVPAIPRYYWRYRMHLTLEALLRERDFTEKVSRLIADAGRQPAA